MRRQYVSITGSEEETEFGGNNWVFEVGACKELKMQVVG